jgi:hypothetical protein
MMRRMAPLRDDSEVAVFADPRGGVQFAPIVAVDSEIFDLVAPKLISFNDEQLAEILGLARTMSKSGRLRYLEAIASRLSREPSDREIRLAIEAAKRASRDPQCAIPHIAPRSASGAAAAYR